MLNVMRDNLQHLKWVLVVVALAMLRYLGSYFDPRAQRGGRGVRLGRARSTAKRSRRRSSCASLAPRTTTTGGLLGEQYEQMKKSLKLGTQAIQTLDRSPARLGRGARSGPCARRKTPISKAILENPSFKDPSGQFRRQGALQEFVGQNFDGRGRGVTSAGSADDILAQKWMDVMTASARISDAELEHAWRTRNVQAAADYVFVPSSAVPLRKERRSTRRSPLGTRRMPTTTSDPRPGRSGSLVVDRQAQVAKAKVTDADVKADYDAHAARVRAPGAAPRASHSLQAAARGERRGQGKPLEPWPHRRWPARRKARTSRPGALAVAGPISAPQGGELGWFGRGRDGEAVRRRRVFDASGTVRSGRRDRIRVPRDPRRRRPRRGNHAARRGAGCDPPPPRAAASPGSRHRRGAAARRSEIKKPVRTSTPSPRKPG